MDSYRKLQEKIKTILQFQSSMGIIQWDMRTKIPPRAYPQRADQLAMMSQILH
ncbi:MAG: carboxypeptidase M32, partial [Candidatus Thorarchaeota archaeon]|nr:carboxypeptidase M32 [Candidatus Thorarchaeota archaeon]